MKDIKIFIQWLISTLASIALLLFGVITLDPNGMFYRQESWLFAIVAIILAITLLTVSAYNALSD